MALDPLKVTSVSLDEYFVNKDTGLPLANGSIEFFKDNDRATPKNVYELTGGPANYTYAALPNPLALSAVGTVVNANGDPVSIYYHPYDANGDLELYYIVAKDSGGTVQFTRQAWPNTTTGLEGVVDVTSPNATLASGNVYIINNGAVQVNLSLPLTAQFGEFYTIVGYSSGGWKVSQNAGQTIHFGNQDTTAGVGGSLTSTNRYDCITLRCVVQDTDFVAYAAQGNITIV